MGKFSDFSVLLLEFIDPKGNVGDSFWEEFAALLAELHRTTSEKFGFEYDNYIGKLPQSNKRIQTWSEFYVTQRLEPLLKKAIDSGFLSGNRQEIERVFSKIGEIFPKEPPALLHGDLGMETTWRTKKGSQVFLTLRSILDIEKWILR